MSDIKIPENRFENWRLLAFYTAVGGLFLFYFFRLFSLQILNQTDYASAAEENYKSREVISASRGLIYDRNGVILARNTASYNLVITPATLPGYADEPENYGAIQEIYRQLSVLTGLPVSKGTLDEQTVRNFSPCISDLGIREMVYIGYTNWPYKKLRIKCNIDEQTAMTIKEKASDWPGVDIEVVPIREYPTGGLTSEIVGFLGPLPAGQEEYDCYKNARLDQRQDKVGYAGIEAELQCDPEDPGKPLLSGIDGERIIQTDVAGQTMGVIGSPIQAVAGNSVTLTIDTRLQDATKAAIRSSMDLWKTQYADGLSSNVVVIAINPKTGELLSLASIPTYENNRMAREIPADYYEQLKADPNKPLFNHAISAELPPGSTFKMAAAIGILNEGVVTPDYQIEDPGKITLENKFYSTDLTPGQDYVCWVYKNTGGGHGMVDFLRGVAESCDIYFYKVGGGYQNEVPNGGLGIYRLGEYAKALGYAHQTGIELPGEASGLIPDPTWKRLDRGENWSTGDTYIGTIGQGYVLSTPIQVLMSVATLANDGKYMKPTLIKDILDPEGHVIRAFQPTQEWDITKDPLITEYSQDNEPLYIYDQDGKTIPLLDENGQQRVDQNGELMWETQKKTVAPWVVKLAQEGMRKVVTDGTAKAQFDGFSIPTAGKTGTAEYCDDIASAQDLCKPGAWPAHAWYAGYAPYDDPEIAVVAFVYHGGEGSTVAAPIVRQVIDAYFRLKQIDQNPSGQ